MGHSLITNKGILSYPRALFEGVAMNTFRVSSLVTALNSNSSSQVCDRQRLTGIERFDKPWAAFSPTDIKVIEFIRKCICVFEARANGFPECPAAVLIFANFLVIVFPRSVSRNTTFTLLQLPKSFQILFGPHLSCSLVLTIPLFHHISYVLCDKWIWFLSYFHCSNGGMVFQASQK